MKRKQILSRRAFLRTSAFASLAAGTTAALGPLGYGGTGFCSQDQPAKLDSSPATDSPPNIILINADDLGYGEARPTWITLRSKECDLPSSAPATPFALHRVSACSPGATPSAPACTACYFRKRNRTRTKLSEPSATPWANWV